MDSGFYAACAGLRAQTQALEVAAHNLANLNTAGFRGQQTTFQSLLAVSHPTVPNVLNLATNNFGVLEGTHLDMTAGNLLTTGNPLDVGIEGTGFFAIQTAHGTRYTRNGNVPAGAISIASDGTLSVNGAVAGSIQLVEFLLGTKLTSEGGTLLAAPSGSAKPAQQSALKQGALESSNVNSISSVVTLIGVQRQAEMLQRALSMFDTVLNKIASSDLAKV